MYMPMARELRRRHKDKILLVPTGIACGDPATPPRGSWLKPELALVSQPRRQESTPLWPTTTAWFVTDRAALEAQGLRHSCVPELRAPQAAGRLVCEDLSVYQAGKGA